MTTPQQVALVTGASSGIGHAAAAELSRRGFAVYAGARRVDRMESLRELGIRTLSLDVTNDASARDAIRLIQNETGRIDLLVNNAGYGSYGAVEDVPLDEGRAQLDVNLFGAIRMIKLVTPLMRTQRAGRILNVTSVGGKIHTPMGAWYHGSKFALEGMSDVLRIELAPYGIHVVVIEPGAVKTEWGTVAAEHLTATSGQGAYAEAAGRLSAWLTSGAGSESGSQPEVIAATIAEAATCRRPRTRYSAGSGARLVLTLRRLLPDRVFDRLIIRNFG